MRTIETTVYTYAELPTEAAKERAREWYREGNLDYDWYTYEWFGKILNCLGIEPKQKVVGRKRDGSPVWSPAFYFSGFCSQGDGASWEGDYHYAAGWRKKLAGETNDPELFQIGERLQELQRCHQFQLHARVYQRGRYSHERTMYIDFVERKDEKSIKNVVSLETELLDCFRGLAQWLYARLEEEHDYQQSDEVVAEALGANGYEFNENGRVI